MLSYLFSKTKKTNNTKLDSTTDTQTTQSVQSSGLPVCNNNEKKQGKSGKVVHVNTKPTLNNNNNNNNATPCKSGASILSIWREKITVGTAVYVQFAGITAHEGVIQQLNFQKGYAVLQNVAGLTYIPLTDAIYVEVLCVKSKNTKCGNKNNNKAGACATVDTNIWANICVGNAVFADVADSPFVATVEEVNLKYGFAGLRTVSGVTFIPFENINLVRVQNCVDIKPRRH